MTALVEAGSSRLEPMLLTTVTTALGILPIALRDKFWSGMGFTIVFGIIAATFLTLFVVKGIYYEIYVADHTPFWKKKKTLREVVYEKIDGIVATENHDNTTLMQELKNTLRNEK